jgi:cell wall-associated NlpC family hydrolase
VGRVSVSAQHLSVTKPILVASAPVLAALAGLGLAAGAATLGAAGTLGSTPASAKALSDIPPAMLGLYRQADTQVCPQMPWQLVAAVGTVESANGTSTLPGVHAGANPAGAEGPMQMLGSSFAAYDQPVPAGGAAPPSPYDPIDAVYAAVRMLCANGAGRGDDRAAIFAYNHSDAYVETVWQTALSYGMAPDGSVGVGLPPASGADVAPGRTYTGDPAAVIAYAQAQLGVPYRWGGTTPGVALDCSGLVYVSYRAAGISLPRTTFAQVGSGVTVGDDSLAPGDLLFFRGGQPIADYGHVAIYLGDGLMIHAPHTGAAVEITAVPAASVELARRILIPAG